ncbi:TPA: Protein N-terminal glutamine amidohydrolase [Trebouxia sp. C0004]
MCAVLSVSDCVYTPCFCEENAYKLCEQLCKRCAHFHVAFISNPARQVPLWQQRASQRSDGFVLWDYHVIVLEEGEKDCLVWDLDTTLPFPCTLLAYADIALNTQLLLDTEFARLFRVVSGNDYLQGFASDRSHMRLSNGAWQAVPPSYPCITASDGAAMRLQDYISMTASACHHDPSAASLLGTVYSEAAFLERFLLQPASHSPQQQQPLATSL